MKQVTLFLAAIAFTFVAIASEGNGEKTSFEIDTKASKVYWTGKKVSGEHTGYLHLKTGTVYVENDKLVGAKVKMDMNTIECTDLSGEWKDKLVGHLKSDDFFSVEKFPTADFKIKEVNGDKVSGELTIKGITHDVSFPARVNVEGNTVTASGTATIDRTKYDIKYGSGKFFSDLGDRMINDEFQITFELTAKSN